MEWAVYKDEFYDFTAEPHAIRGHLERMSQPVIEIVRECTLSWSLHTLYSSQSIHTNLGFARSGSGFGPPGLFFVVRTRAWYILGFGVFRLVRLFGAKIWCWCQLSDQIGNLPFIPCMTGLSLCLFLFRKWLSVEEGRAFPSLYAFQKQFALQVMIGISQFQLFHFHTWKHW